MRIWRGVFPLFTLPPATEVAGTINGLHDVFLALGVLLDDGVRHQCLLSMHNSVAT